MVGGEKEGERRTRAGSGYMMRALSLWRPNTAMRSRCGGRLRRQIAEAA